MGTFIIFTKNGDIKKKLFKVCFTCKSIIIELFFQHIDLFYSNLELVQEWSSLYKNVKKSVKGFCVDDLWWKSQVILALLFFEL